MNSNVSDNRRQLPIGTVEARVRRQLRGQGEILRKTRNDELGPYYTVDQHCGNPIRWGCDIEALARECGALRPSEAIED